MILANAPLFYPSAREWMWNYCIYLGPFTDSKGRNYDLGIFIDDEQMSNATVFGNTPGQYSSGEFFPILSFNNEVTREVLRRAKELNLIK